MTNFSTGESRSPSQHSAISAIDQSPRKRINHYFRVIQNSEITSNVTGMLLQLGSPVLIRLCTTPEKVSVYRFHRAVRVLYSYEMLYISLAYVNRKI